MAIGVAAEGLIETLLFEVTTRQPGRLVVPLASLLAVATLAAVLAVLRALRISPGTLLRQN